MRALSGRVSLAFPLSTVTPCFQMDEVGHERERNGMRSGLRIAYADGALWFDIDFERLPASAMARR